METIHITASSVDSSQLEALKAFMKALKIKFSLKKEKENPYNPEFVEKILQGDKQIAEGKGIKMTLPEFKELCKLN